MSRNAIPWNKENQKLYGKEIELRYKINKKFERLYDLETEIKHYYFRNNYILMESRLIEYKKNIFCILEWMQRKKCFQKEFTNELKSYRKKYEVLKNLK
jgi:hypothetical protein